MANESHVSGIDDKFLSRVYRGGIISGIFISGALCFYKIQAAVSFAMGGAISLSFLWTLEYVVRSTLVPGKQNIKKSLVLLALVKYIVIGVCFYFLLVRTKWLNAPALAAGLGLVYAVITVKAFHIALFK